MKSFAEAVEEFRSAQEEYADFGASDTEPRCVFRLLIEDLYEGNEVKVPTTIRGWQLFSTMPGAGKAARALTRAAKAAITAGKRDTLGVARFIKAW